MSEEYFDIVICVGPDDKEIVIRQLEYTRKNVKGYRMIYIIPCDPALRIDGTVTVPESRFPFSLSEVRTILGNIEHDQSHNIKKDHNRHGWYLQQLLKLYAAQVIPELSEYFLVLDADTFFIKPTYFIDSLTKKPLITTGTDIHTPYFEHMEKLHPTFKTANNHMSGITNHMMFQKKYIKEIMEIVEDHHHTSFWNIFLKTVNPNILSSASEYEIYFNYMLRNHPQEITYRQLRIKTIYKLSELSDPKNYWDGVSYHWHTRREDDPYVPGL